MTDKNVLGSATTADLHIRKNIWSSRPELKNDTIFAMQFFFDYCIENRLSAKLAGDIFHTLAVLPESVYAVQQQIDRMAEAGLPVYYIQGNHDNNDVPWLHLHKWPINLDNRVIELDECGETIAGKQYSSSEELKLFLETLAPEVDTLLLHQAEETAMPYSPNFWLDDVPESVKLVLIGDIHTGQEYCRGNTWLYYPGSPCLSDRSDTEPKSFIVEKKVNDKTEVSRVTVPGRSIYVVTIDDEDGLDKADATIRLLADKDPRNFGLEPIIRLVYPAGISQAVKLRLQPLKEAVSVYLWMDSVSAGLSDEDNMQKPRPLPDGGAIQAVISESVTEEWASSILLEMFRTNDVNGVLSREMEKIL
jgi:DNA repair exonuclease SbcCD nuclease subunit